MAQTRKKKKSSLAFPVGVLTVVLAVVGLITTVNWAKTKMQDSKEKLAECREYEEFLKPVVMFDPDPFDDISSADISQLVNAAIWSVVTANSSTDAYAYSSGETVGIILPKDYVTKECQRLFGTEVNFDAAYNSLDMSDFDISYDPVQGGFIVPITGLDVCYIPHVYSVKAKGAATILNVGFISAKAWSKVQDDSYSVPEADRFMQITLRAQDNGEGYYISSIQAADTKEVASVKASTTVPAVTEPETLEEETNEDGTPVSTSAQENESETGTSIEFETLVSEPVTDEDGNPIEPETDENGDPIVPVEETSIF